MAALIALIRFFVIKLSLVFLLKFVTALGIGIYSFTELSEFWRQMQQEFYSGYRSLPSVMVALMDIGGFSTALNIMMSGISFLVAYYSAEQFFRILGFK